MNAKDLKLDYFQFYDVVDQILNEPVLTQGQFDEQPEPIRLTYLNLFANPVSKNGEELYNKHAHLIWYNVFDPVPEPTRIVVVANQFGEQKILTGRTIGFLTPTQKHERGSKFPNELDHFKVYLVLHGQGIDKRVKLKDQFGADEADVYYPIAFAVPVRKQHWHGSFGVQNRDAHLVIYRITPRKLEKPVLARDQFGRHQLHVYRRLLLAAPSKKLKWQVED
jgi:hypothetical protein